jgi:hypothetical protein
MRPNVEKPLTSASEKTLKVAPVEDTRTVTDKKVAFQKVNGYGAKTSGAYVADRPIADIFHDALVSALQSNRFPVNDNASGSLRLNTTIEDFDFAVLTGFWAATVEPKFRVKFSVIEESSNKVLWKENYTGKVQRKTAWGTASFAAEIFSAAAEDAIRQLIEDKTFRALFEGSTAANP